MTFEPSQKSGKLLETGLRYRPRSRDQPAFPGLGKEGCSKIAAARFETLSQQPTVLPLSVTVKAASGEWPKMENPMQNSLQLHLVFTGKMWGRLARLDPPAYELVRKSTPKEHRRS